MKITTKLRLLVSIFIFTAFSCLQSQGEAGEKWAEKIADSFIELHPDTVAYKTEAKSYKWNYEQGLMLDAFYQLWRQTRNDKYFNYIKMNIDYYIQDDGTIKTYKLGDYNLDNISPGRILLYMYEASNNEKYKAAADTLKKQLKHQPKTPSGGFWHKKIYPNQMWMDGLYMAEPFNAKYSLMFDNTPAAYEDIAQQFLLIEKHLKDEKTGLYYHGWDESKEQKWADPVKGTSPNFWGRAMGWFMMSIVDVLDFIPEENLHRKDLVRILRNISESLLKYRNENTKLWYQVIDKGDKEGNYIESSVSAMIIYAYAKGANKGYLDKKYFDAAKESFTGLIKNQVTTANGNIYLNNNCAVGGLGGNPYRDGSFEYYIGEPKRTNDFKGYGPFLLAAIELEK